MSQPAIGPQAETLEYIQSMLRQLRTMAESQHCDMLVYLIEMASIEAGDAMRGARAERPAASKARSIR